MKNVSLPTVTKNDCYGRPMMSINVEKVYNRGLADRRLERLLSGSADANFRFQDLRGFLLRFGFGERIKGSHHIFKIDGVGEILNLQPRGTTAKPYQVNQVRNSFCRIFNLDVGWNWYSVNKTTC